MSIRTLSVAQPASATPTSARTGLKVRTALHAGVRGSIICPG